MPSTSANQVSLTPSILGAGVWTWALALLAMRRVQILDATIISPAPPVWGFLSLPGVELLAVLALGIGVGWISVVVSQRSSQTWGSFVWWMLGAFVIVGLDFARLLGVTLPVLFVESLWFVAVTGGAATSMMMSVGTQGPTSEGTSPKDRTWLAVTWAATVLAGFWWYWQGVTAWENFALGFQDFGHFARRVINTWEGRGFLSKTPSLPPFWDHFNPGLALLAPLWGIWPSAKLFLLIQAVCLSIPAPMVYAIARRLQHGALAASCWAVAFLLFPAVGQMNLNYTYGWHPVSLAMPLLFATLALLLSGRLGWSATAAVLACSFNEAVLVALGCFAAMMALVRFVESRDSLAGQGLNSKSRRWSLAPSMPFAKQLGVVGWLAVWAVITLAFILIWKFAGFSEFQGSRVTTQLALSNAWKLDSLWFVLGLTVPVGLVSLVRGWPVAATLGLPVLTLLTWSYIHSTSLAFQYASTLAPFLFAAAIAGANRRPTGENQGEAVGDKMEVMVVRSHSTATAVGVLAMALVATTFYGAWPWSRLTIELTSRLMYPDAVHPSHPERLPGSDGLAALREAVAIANDPEAAILATGYVAPHLLGARRLEPVNEAANERREALAAEAGDGRHWLELFDWLVLDLMENFQQPAMLSRSVADEAQELGYEVVFAQLGVVVLRRTPGL